MRKSSRVALAAGPGLLCLVALAARGQDDAAAKPAAPQQAAAPPAPARIACIDMERVFKEYKKFKFTTEQFKADATTKQGELTRLGSQMKELAAKLEGLNPGGADFKATESEMTRLRVQYEAEREQAQADFARREAEALATIYKEVQNMTQRVAQSKGFQYVVKVSSEPITGSDPNSVMAAMARSIVYYDPSMDVTNLVIVHLNLQYDRSGAAQPQSAAAPADPAARPTAGAGQPAARPATKAAAGAAPGGAPARR